MGPRVLAVMLLLSVFVNAEAAVDYNLALEKAVLYFDAQMSGKLDPGHRVSWRGDSGLSDGSAQGVSAYCHRSHECERFRGLCEGNVGLSGGGGDFCAGGFDRGILRCG